jgi:hypothetical protein
LPHQRDICLCPECHVRDATHDDEVRTLAKLAIATLAAKCKRRVGVRLVEAKGPIAVT